MARSKELVIIEPPPLERDLKGANHRIADSCHARSKIISEWMVAAERQETVVSYSTDTGDKKLNLSLTDDGLVVGSTDRVYRVGDAVISVRGDEGEWLQIDPDDTDTSPAILTDLARLVYVASAKI